MCCYRFMSLNPKLFSSPIFLNLESAFFLFLNINNVWPSFWDAIKCPLRSWKWFALIYVELWMIWTTCISMALKGRKTEHSRFNGKEVMHRSTMLLTYFIQSISTFPMFHSPHFRDLGAYINLLHFGIHLPVCPKMVDNPCRE